MGMRKLCSVYCSMIVITWISDLNIQTRAVVMWYFLQNLATSSWIRNGLQTLAPKVWLQTSSTACSIVVIHCALVGKYVSRSPRRLTNSTRYPTFNCERVKSVCLVCQDDTSEAKIASPICRFIDLVPTTRSPALFAVKMGRNSGIPGRPTCPNLIRPISWPTCDINYC